MRSAAYTGGGAAADHPESGWATPHGGEPFLDVDLAAALDSARSQVDTARRQQPPRQRLDHSTKEYIHKLLHRAASRDWCAVRGRLLAPPKLHPVITRTIREWFELVDDDGSGTLEHHELLAALQTAQLPVEPVHITEMIRLIDANRDGCIGWDEFEGFMSEEISKGKNLLTGEYVLPSGMALPFGAMIGKLKRNRMIADVMEGGPARTRWLANAPNLAREAAEVAAAEATLLTQRKIWSSQQTARRGGSGDLGRPHSPLATSPPVGQGYAPGLEAPAGGGATSRLADVAGPGGPSRRHTAAAAAAGRISSPQMQDLVQSAPYCTSPPQSPPARSSRLSTAHGASGDTTGSLQKPGSAGGTMYCTASSSLTPGGLATVRARSAAKGISLAGVTSNNLEQEPTVVVAGVPVNRRTGSDGGMLTVDHAADMPLGGLGSGATPRAPSAPRQQKQQRPAQVPRLDLSGLTGSGGAAAAEGGGWGGGVTSRSEAFLSAREGLALLNGTARAHATKRLSTVVEAGSVLSSARPSYRLQPGAAAPAPPFPLGSHLVAHATPEMVLEEGAAEEGHPDVEGVWQLLPPHLRGTSSLHAAMQGAGVGGSTTTATSSSRAAHTSPRGDGVHAHGSSSRSASPTGRHHQQQDGGGGVTPVVVRSDPWGSLASSALTHHHARQMQPGKLRGQTSSSPPPTADVAGIHVQLPTACSSRGSSPRRCREGALLRQTAAAGFATPSSRYLNAPSSAKVIAPRQLLTTGQLSTWAASAAAAEAAASDTGGGAGPHVPLLHLPAVYSAVQHGAGSTALTSRLTPQARPLPHRGAMTARLPGGSTAQYGQRDQHYGSHGSSPHIKAGQQLVATNLGLLPCGWGPKPVTRAAPGRARGSCGGGSTGGAAECGSDVGAGNQHHTSTAVMLSNSPLATWRQRDGGGADSHRQDVGAGHRRSSTGARGSAGGGLVASTGVLPHTGTLLTTQRPVSGERKQAAGAGAAAAAARHPLLRSRDVSNGHPQPYTPRGKAKTISIW